MHVPLQFMSFRKLAISFSAFFVCNFKSKFWLYVPSWKGTSFDFYNNSVEKNECGT